MDKQPLPFCFADVFSLSVFVCLLFFLIKPNRHIMVP